MASPATSAQYLAGSGVGLSVLLRQANGLEGLSCVPVAHDPPRLVMSPRHYDSVSRVEGNSASLRPSGQAVD
jgi:hypothetical protein